MTVNQERQTWKCWPCDIGGDIFSFVMQRDGVDFPTAVRTLAELAGIPVEEYRRGKKTQPGSPEDKATLLAAMQLVSDAYFEELERGTSDDAKLARDYLAERGISDESRRSLPDRLCTRFMELRRRPAAEASLQRRGCACGRRRLGQAIGRAATLTCSADA